MKFHEEHLGLPSRDPAGLKDWYVRTLGAEIVFDNGEMPPAFFLKLGGGLMIEIYAGDRAIPETANNSLSGWRHLALRVESIETARAELEKRGVQFDQPVKPAGGGGGVLFFKDAEGNLLHLVERPTGSIFDRAMK